MLDKVRIPATVLVVPEPSTQAISTACADAAVVMVPGRLRRDELLNPIEEDLYTLLKGLPMAATIIAAAQVDLVAGPESETHSAIAAAEDRLAATQDRLKRISEQVTKIDDRIADLHRNADSGGADEIDSLLDAAEARQATLRRRMAKARAAREIAEQELASLEKDRLS